MKSRSLTPAVLTFLAVLAFWSWGSSGYPALADDSAARVAVSCRLTATVTPDNDIRLDDDDRQSGKKVEAPKKVMDKMRIIAAGLLRKYESPDPYPGECEDIFKGLFRIAAARDVYLYVAEIAPNNATRLFFLILFDPATGTITSDPPMVDAKWTLASGWADPRLNAMLTRPLIAFADLLHNDHRQIVVEERVHNGTMYNGVVDNYFEVGPSLSLTRVLAVEKSALAIGNEEGVIVRTLSASGRNRLRLDSVFKPDGKARAPLELGYVILERPGPDSPFHIKERHPRTKDSASILVTSAPADTSGGDEAFVRNGYTFRY